LNKFAEAEVALRSALEKDPRNIGALLSLAQTLEGAGNLKEATVYRHLFDRAWDALERRERANE
jgi:Tfp pilus assembly protein PilF